MSEKMNHPKQKENKNPLFRFRHFSMRAQLTLVTTLIILFSFGLIIYTIGNRQIRSFMDEYSSSTQTILDMETASLDQYIRDLRSFCVQPCLNVSVYNSLLKTNSLTSEERKNIQQEIQSEFHSRTDLLSYSITAFHHSLCFERPHGGQHVIISSAENSMDTKAFRICGDSEKYEYIAPSDRTDTFFRYYHYLIRIRDRSPVSISCIDVDTTQMKLLLENHRKYEETLCLYNSSGELLYTDLDVIKKLEQEKIREIMNLALKDNSITISGNTYLTTHSVSNETGIVLISLLPKSVLTYQTSDFMKPLVFEAVLILALLLVAVTFIIRMITVPLTRLSDQMSKMGEGDFSPFETKSGCKETEALTVSYNNMASRINHLIETNYISSINEKNSRLKALEAQLNPHFLYNTLQAIATEALLADHSEIYDMIVSLSANLRYTIKGDELVCLRDEMNYVERYILLQKTRLGSRLSVVSETDPETEGILIPKISIQMLVENSIIHGLPGNEEVLHLTIRSAIVQSFLCVSVYDDGIGIPEERINELNQILSDPGHGQTEDGSLGLLNLAGRLRILYQGQSSLTLRSKENQYTEVEMRIPVSESEHIS